VDEHEERRSRLRLPTFLQWLRVRLVDERGDVFVEYVVLAGVAVLVIMAAVQYFGGGLAEMFRRLIDTVTGQ